VYTGMRTIEVRRLTWNDVSLSEGTMRVFGKGDKWRVVPIHPRLRRILIGRTFDHGSIHVVPGRHGGMVSAGGLHYRLKQIATGDIRNHDFRRTVATSLRQNRCDPYVRDAIMGWTRDEMFAQAYNAVSPRELHEGMALLYADDPV
jgi:integrase/recombinase XerD